MKERLSREQTPPRESYFDKISALPKSLRYSSDAEVEYARRRRGSEFSYHDEDGVLIMRQAIIERINVLGLPPAYDDVWICRDAFGHLQATS